MAAAPDAPQGSHVLAYSLGWRLATTIPGVLIAVAWSVDRWVSASPRIPLAFLIAAIGFLGAAAETWRVRIRVDDHGLRSRSPWQREVVLAWSDVTRVSWSPVMQAWSIEGASGRIWAGSSLGGIPTLAAELLARVPRDRIDAEVALDLEQRAAAR